MTVNFQRKKKQISFERRQERAFYLIMIPFIVMFLLLKVYSLIWGGYISTTNYNGFNLNALKNMGFKNYINVFSDFDALPAIGRSFLLLAIITPVKMIINVFIAWMVHRDRKGIRIARVLLYIPSAIPALASVLFFKVLFEYTGLLNAIVSFFGLPKQIWVSFEYARFALTLMFSWIAIGGYGTTMIAMKNVPNDYYEAARIEGANAFHRVRHITVPLISNCLYMQILGTFMELLQMFDKPVLLSGTSLTDVPVRPIYTFMVHVYQQIFVFRRFGYGIALSFILFAIIMVVTLLMELFKKRWVYTEI